MLVVARSSIVARFSNNVAVQTDDTLEGENVHNTRMKCARNERILQEL